MVSRFSVRDLSYHSIKEATDDVHINNLLITQGKNQMNIRYTKSMCLAFAATIAVAGRGGTDNDHTIAVFNLSYEVRLMSYNIRHWTSRGRRMP